MKRFLFSLVLLLNGITAFAQETEQPSGSIFSDLNTNDIVLMIVVGLLIFIALVLIFLVYMAFDFIHVLKESHGGFQNKSPLINLTKAIPLERESEIMFDHEYDGIRELDNQLPPWWVYMFYATIIFSVVYMWYYHIHQDGNVQEEEYRQEIVAAEVLLKQQAEKVNENSVTLLSDESRIAKGAEIYLQNCKACHGANGEGTVGPNLTDEYSLHGADIKSLFKTIKYGVPQKGMIAWQSQLSPSQIQEVASYIHTLKGTNPPNPKAPQGEKVVSEQ